jgi:hypothetical protein
VSITAVPPSTSYANPSKPLPTPPLCFQIRVTNASFIETRERRIEIFEFRKRTNHTVTLSLSSPCLERLRLALGFVTERSQIHRTPARRSPGAYCAVTCVPRAPGGFRTLNPSAELVVCARRIVLHACNPKKSHGRDSRNPGTLRKPLQV